MWYYYFIIIVLVICIHKWLTRIPKTKLNSESVVLITGGCSGLGKSTAIILSKRYKLKLIILDIRSDLFQTVLYQIQSTGGSAQFYKCDLTKREQIDQVISKIKVKYSKIDVLVNNAGIAFDGFFYDISYQRQKKLFDVNYFAPVYLLNCLFDQVKEGHLVNIASMASINHSLQMSTYVASKHALYGYFNCVRLQLFSKQIPLTMSIVCPFFVDTPLITSFKDKIPKQLPLLNEHFVAQQIVDRGIINKQQIVMITRTIDYILKIIRGLPLYYREKLLIGSMYKQSSQIKKNE